MSHSCRSAAAFAVLALVVATARAEDEVHRFSSKVKLSGKISAESADAITIERKDNGKTETVAVNDIDRIQYDGPIGLEVRKAELLEQGGEYAKAIDAYAKAADQAADGSPARRAAQFGGVRSMVRQAERSPDRGGEALQALAQFRSQNPGSRFHYALAEMTGQLALASGKGDAARAAFAELAKAPWPATRLKAALYEGRILLREGKPDQAFARFDEVVRTPGDSGDEQQRKQEARVARAEALIQQKKHAEAEKELRAVIDEVPSSESSIQAAAHNLLGDAEREMGKPKDAMFAYLYVDFMFSGERAEHAKALAYIARLWDQAGHPDRAEEARSRLKATYPASDWLRVAAGSSSPAAESKTGAEQEKQ